MRLCKKNDKYQVCQLGWLCLKSDLLLGEIRQVTELEMISELLAEVKNSGEVEEQAKSFSGFHPHLVSEQANRKPPTYKPPIWEINKISSEILDKLECGKFETKRGGGVLWGLMGAEQHCSPEMGVMKDSATHPIFSPLKSVLISSKHRHCCTYTIHVQACYVELNRVVYCWLGWWWLGANFHRFVSAGVVWPLLAGLAEEVGSTQFAFHAFSTQPPKPGGRTRELQDTWKLKRYMQADPERDLAYLFKQMRHDILYRLPKNIKLAQDIRKAQPKKAVPHIHRSKLNKEVSHRHSLSCPK